MTSSALLTWANSGSDPKLRGAGQAAGPTGPVRAAAATRGAANEIADKASPANASRTAALNRPRVTILTTPPFRTHPTANPRFDARPAPDNGPCASPRASPVNRTAALPRNTGTNRFGRNGRVKGEFM